jgi:CRISPR-associated endonuclease Cas1
VLLGHSGFVTLDALAWLRGLGAALVQIGHDGEVLTHSVPFGYNGHPIRRAQALAVTNGLDLMIARDLIASKLENQRRILIRLGADLREFDKSRAAIVQAKSIDRVRTTEANAAAVYFACWKNVRMRFRERDVARIPARWLRTDTRASLLTGAPRAATSPINALRNYLFACLKSEARLALLAHGCDPAMGVLHADQRNRDSLALDILEPVRADVDAFLLDLLEDRLFTARDFVELSNGVCRIAAPLTHELALTLPHWRECLRPITANLAQTFRKPAAIPSAALHFGAKEASSRPSVSGIAKSSLAATPRRVRRPRPYATREWGTPTSEAPASASTACAMCGEPVLKRRRRHCEGSIPKARREHGLRAIEAARKTLAQQTAEGNDPRKGIAVNRARGEAISEGHRRNRSWSREHPGQRDEAWFKREIVPKLDAFTLAEIAAATSLSLAACSRIRAGARVPHTRHWQALLALVGRR